MTGPYCVPTIRDICFKFGSYIDDGSLLRPDHKMTPKLAWPGSRDRILHWKDELLTCQLMLRVVFANPDIRYPDIWIYPLILWQPKIRISWS